MPIPEGITIDHVLQAIQRVNGEGVPPHRNYVHHALLYNNVHYPCKLLISWGHEVAYGHELSSNDFNTTEAQNYLTDLEFNVIHL